MKFNNKIILLTLFTLTSCNPNLNDSDSFEKSKLIPEEPESYKREDSMYRIRQL